MNSPGIPRRLLLAGTSAALLPVRSSLAAGIASTPEQTEGPFYPVQFPDDLDSDGKPMRGVQVDIWQCDSHGLYDHPRQPGRTQRDQAFQGYGRMLAAADGGYSFRTLKPVAYPGRTPHIHLKVARYGGATLTSQFYIAGDPQNARDFVYREAMRDPRQRDRIEMNLQPASGLEPGALATTMDIVVG